MKTLSLPKFLFAIAALLTAVACGSKSNNNNNNQTCYTPQGTAYTCTDGASAYGTNGYGGYGGQFGGGFNSGYGYGNQYGSSAIRCIGQFVDVYNNVGYCGPQTLVPFCSGYQMRTLQGQPVYCQ